MAETLAQLYWNAHVDANDIEFVLAPSREARAGVPPTASMQSPVIGEHSIWILDFDCCKDMALSQSGVEQAVTAFYRNDPYYPRPGRENTMDQILWEAFKTQFLEASAIILDQESPESLLPPLWVASVERLSQPGEAKHN
ncbi:MAG: hypothetical protein Q9196_006829 [Gyalolechia fulgens]